MSLSVPSSLFEAFKPPEDDWTFVQCADLSILLIHFSSSGSLTIFVEEPRTGVYYKLDPMNPIVLRFNHAKEKTSRLKRTPDKKA